MKSQDSTAVEAQSGDVEQQLEELFQLAATAQFSEFYSNLLDRAAQAVAARAAVVWTSQNQNSTVPWKLDLAWGLTCDELERLTTSLDEHALEVGRTLSTSNEADVTFEPLAADRESDWLRAIVGMSVNGRTVAAIEFFWDSTLTSAAQRNTLHLIRAYAETAAEFHRHQQVLELREGLEEESTLNQFALSLQEISRPKAVWYAIANELARLVSSDRVALLTARGGWRVRAISHVDTFDKRSPVIRTIERLAATAATESKPIWLHTTLQADSLAAAPQWHRYLEESSARSAVLVPLFTRVQGDSEKEAACPLGAVLIERLRETSFSANEQHRIERGCQHVAAALARLAASQNESSWAKVRRMSTVVGLFLLVAMMAAAFIPVNFEITARGELQPVVRHDIFSPTDGLVRELHVRDGQEVAPGTPLLELTNDDLEFDLTRIGGELQTARQQLLTVQAARLESSPNAPQREQRGQLAGEEERLKQVIQGLEAQNQLLLRRREKLTIRSPIAGRIITANVEQLLRSRPLRRGQRLLTIADERQAWQLEMHIEDQDVGHVLAARQSRADLPIHFVLATQSSKSHHAVVEQVGTWTELDRGETPSVRVTARIESASGLAVRPGATIAAKIHCGRKALGYVWFRDLIELIRMKVLF